jgi:hypothetical protein
MGKKFISFMLVMSIFLTSIPFNKVLATDINNDMVLVNTEVFMVEDDQGNEFEVILEEYEEEYGVQSRGMIKEYPIGTRRSYVFKISNTALEIPTFAQGAPISAAAKKKAMSILTTKLGEKLGSSIIPGLNVASWVALGVGLMNDLVGNNGFEFSIGAIYSEDYYNKDGYYVYGWDLDDFSVRTY